MHLSLLALALLLSPPGSDGFTHLDEEDGVTVESRPSGRALPTYRAVAEVPAAPLEILAVIEDVRRQPEWMKDCAESALLERTDPWQARVYVRFDPPWPADDRDVVIATTLTASDGGRRLDAAFAGIRSRERPPREGVVRMPALSGRYLITALTAASSRVEYTVDLDLGGSLPDGIARDAAEGIALESVLRLRRQVERTRGLYGAYVAEWSARLAAAAQPPQGAQQP